MKAFSVCLAFFIFTLNAGAAEQSTLSTKAETVKAAAPSKWGFGYSYHHYSMVGTSTANTNIYKFGDASVDLQLYTLSYALSPKWTIMTVVPYLRNQVETVYEPVSGGLNLALTDTTEGLSDVKLLAIRPLLISGSYVSVLDFGVSIPTGKTDATFNSAPYQGASYNMQLGSGTFDPYMGITSTHITTKDWMQSVRLAYTHRLGRNSHGWALGDEITGQVSSKYQVFKWLNSGLAFNAKNRDKVHGRDKKYELMNNYQSSVAQGDGHKYYHEPQSNVDLTAMAKAEYKYRSMGAALEVGVPLWQDAKNADNIRLDTRYYVSGSASAAF